MTNIMQHIKESRYKLMQLCKEPREVRMSMPTYYDLVNEVKQIPVVNFKIPEHIVLESVANFEIPENVILHENGEQIPMGKVYGLNIFIDNRLPYDQIIIQ